jgi:hypothetical protein
MCSAADLTRLAFAVCAVLFLLCLILAALCVFREESLACAESPSIITGQGERLGGGPRLNHAASPHIVVDTLNLMHWAAARAPKKLARRFTVADAVIETINWASPILKRRHEGRVMFVVKDRNTQHDTAATRLEYEAAAVRNGVYLYETERYVDPPKGVPASAEHSAHGRDDFMACILAWRWRCAVLTEDRLRDFDRFRATLQPFHVTEYAFWRALPQNEYVRPEAAAHARLKKPRMVRFSNYFLAGAAPCGF